MDCLRPPLPALLLAVLLALPAAAQSVGIHWQQDIESAKKLARESGRLVLVHFWTTSCGPCMALEQNVFNQPGVGTAIESQFVPVKLDANANSATAVGFGITRVPTDVVITPDGEVVGKLISPPTPSAYVAELSQLAGQYATRSGQAFADAAAGAPFAPPQVINSAYANLPVSQNTAPAAPMGNSPAIDRRFASAAGDDPHSVPIQTSTATAGAASSATVGSVANYAVGQQPPGGRYATYSGGNQPPVQPASIPGSTGQASYQGFGSPGTGSQLPVSAPLAPPAIVPPAVIGNGYANAATAAAIATPAVGGVGTGTTTQSAPPPTAANSQLANPYAANPAAAAANLAIQQPAMTGTNAAPVSRQLPPGAPPLGFDGYCPVSMRNHWKWIPGDPRFGVIHRGRTYWFAGPEEQQQFWANPDLYSPALSGNDPVLAVDHKQQVPGKREHSLDYDNLFYLFSSESTLQQFAANPERYAVSVRQAMGIQRGQFVR